MLSAPIAVQSFEAVARQSPQIVEPFRRVDGEKLGSRSALNLVRQSFDRVAGKQRCRSLVGEASDHIVKRTVKRYVGQGDYRLLGIGVPRFLL